jgi:hypothetical protein
LWDAPAYIWNYRPSRNRRETTFWQPRQAKGGKCFEKLDCLEINTFVQPFQYGQTEVLKTDDIPKRIRDLFTCERPLILLVHDEDAVRSLLKDLNIDTSNFVSGLKSLLQ